MGSYLFAPQYVMHPPFTEHVSIHRKSSYEKMAYVSGGYTKGKTLKYDFDALISRVDNKF